MERTDGRVMNKYKSMLEDLQRLLHGKFLKNHAPLSPEGTALKEELALNESTLIEVLQHSKAKGRCE